MAEGLSEGGSGSLVLSKLSGTVIYWYNVRSDLPLLSAPTVRRFQPVGRWYESRARHVRLLSGGSSGGGVVGESSEEGEEGRGDEINPLLLDPTQWKVYTPVHNVCTSPGVNYFRTRITMCCWVSGN